MYVCIHAHVCMYVCTWLPCDLESCMVAVHLRTYVRAHACEWLWHVRTMYTHNMLTTNTSNMDVGTENRSKVKLVSFLHFHGTPCLPACLPACIVPLRSWRAKNRTITETFQDNNRNIYALLGQLRFNEIHKCGLKLKIPGHNYAKIVRGNYQRIGTVPAVPGRLATVCTACTFLMLREA